MATVDQVIDKLNALTPEQQEQVLELVEFLAHQRPNGWRKDPFGLLGHLNLDISAEDIDSVRREVWGNSPREDID